MNVLILKNTPIEGPGTIEDFLKERAIPYSIVELSLEQGVPAGDFSHLVMMGGPMAVYEMDRHKFLSAGAEMLSRFTRAGRPALGVCLGAQMLAHVLGARVYAGGEKEIGWYDVAITGEGMADPVFSSLGVDGRNFAQVFQWHGDTFTLPEGAVRLASSPVYENQAFRWGDKVYGLQFHIEVTPEIIARWFQEEQGPRTDEMVRKSKEIFSAYLKRAYGFYEEFFK